MTTSAVPPAGAPPTPARHAGASLALICTAMFMLMLDMTVVAVALPDIQQSLDADLADLQWVVDAYTLPLAALLLAAATLADRVGRKRVFLVGMTVFTAGSLACALAVAPLMLTVMRALQGIGAAMLFGTTTPILGAAYPDPRGRAKAIGLFGATLASAIAIGPLLGGLIVDHAGWQWIFAINVPIGLAALVVGRRVLSESRAERPRDPDWTGTVLLTVLLGALVFALIRGQSAGWSAPLIVACFGASALSFAGFLARSVRRHEPLVDLSLFREPVFVGISLTALIVSATIVAVANYIGLYFVNTLGYSPFIAGLCFLPLSIASFLAAPAAARVSHRIRPVWTLGGSLATVTVGLAWAARVDASSTWLTLAPGLLLCGIGLGASGAVLSAAALDAVEPDRAGMATGVVNTMRQVGTAAGVAALGAVFTARTSDAVTGAHQLAHLPTGAVHRLADAVSSGAGTQVLARTPAPWHGPVRDVAIASTAHGIHTILLIAAVIAAIGLAVCTWLLSRDGGRPAHRTPDRHTATERADSTVVP